MAKTEKIQINSRGFNDVIDLTRKINNIVQTSGYVDCAMHIFAPPASAIFILPKGAEIIHDLLDVLGTIVPLNKNYQYDAKGPYSNAFAHIRASIAARSISVPIWDGRMLVEGEQIVFIDFDNKSQKRTITVQLVG